MFKNSPLLIMVALGMAFPGIRAGAADRGIDRLITVRGEAEIKVAPNQAAISLGVETWNKDLDTARKTNDDRVYKVFGLLNQFQIQPDDIQTNYISIEPTYESHTDAKTNVTEKILTGYKSEKTISVTIRDLSKFEKILSTVQKEGANRVNGVELRNTDLRKYRDQARAQAMRAAKEKATALAQEIGQKIGAAVSITEETPTPWWPVQNAQNVSQSAGGDGSEAGESTMAPGRLSIGARVLVSFELQ